MLLQSPDEAGTFAVSVLPEASPGETTHALALADGAKLGTYRLGVPIASSPVIADGTLYVGGYDGNLYAFSVRD